jgi:hypothetical protein
VADLEQIGTRVQGVFGRRLCGLFAFGSRIANSARVDSDLDLAVWLEGPLKRRNTWVRWVEEFADDDPILDPTFLTASSFENPPPWLLEAVRGGVAILVDPHGRVARHLEVLRNQLHEGRYRRRLFMGLPYYEQAAL